MTPRRNLNKTALVAVLHGSMFSKLCALAQGRVPRTRPAAHAAALRLLYHISKLALRVPLVFTKKHSIYAARLMLRLRLAFTNRTYYTTNGPPCHSAIGGNCMAHGLSLSLARTAQKAPRRTAGCFLILLCKQAANQARRHADAVQQRHDK